MKKHLPLLFIATLTFLSVKVIAQPNFTVNPTSQCYNAGSNTATVGVIVLTPGAATYSWSVVGTGTNSSCNGTYTNAATNGSVINVSYPCCGVYTINCIPIDGSGNPLTTIVHTATVTCLPIITVNASPSFQGCAGTTFNFTASGAQSYTWLPSYLSFPAISVSPITTTGYTVMGLSTQGGQTCTGQTVVYANIITPTVTITGATNTVCAGSSVVLVANSSTNIPTPMTYTWMPGSLSGSSVAVIPTYNSQFTLSASNGTCSSVVTTSLTVDTTCAMVWPGDANSDGIVNSSDVFELGLAFSNTGAARSPGGNAYTGQYANAWTGNGSTGKNKCHVDCNGDGTINNADTVAIFNNYSLTHSFKTSGSSGLGDVTIVATQASEGVWNKADIMLGNSSGPINQVYGVAFDIDFDNTLVETNSAYIVYTSSFLNAGNQNVQFRKTNFSNGKVHAASVRVSGNDVSGNGKIGEFWFKVKTALPDNSSLNLSVSSPVKIGQTGATAPINGGSAIVAIVKTYVGMKEAAIFDQSVQFFPNPAANQLTLQSEVKSIVAYSVSDVIGRQVTNGEFAGSKTIDISVWQNGTYIVRFADEKNVSYKKLIIEK